MKKTKTYSGAFQAKGQGKKAPKAFDNQKYERVRSKVFGLSKKEDHGKR